jgi:hypothetical protein
LLPTDIVYGYKWTAPAPGPRVVIQRPDRRIVVDANGVRVSLADEEMVKKARPLPPSDPVVEEFPWLAPLPGAKKIGWWTRLRARIYMWVRR